MKFLIQNSNNVAVYADDNLVLTASGVRGTNFRDQYFTTANSALIDVTTPPDWSSNAWSYTAGLWAVADSTRQATFLAEKAVADAKAAKVVQDATDTQAAKLDAKLTAIANMTPTQVRAWVAANVITLPDVKDMIATLAVMVSLLARKI